MIEFARGTLLGRSLASDIDGAVLIYTAKVKTELSLLRIAYQVPTGTGGSFIAYHVPAPGGTPTTIDIVDIRTFDRTTGDGDGFVSPAIGSGLPLEVGDQLWVEIEAADAVIHAYGVTATLPARR